MKRVCVITLVTAFAAVALHWTVPRKIESPDDRFWFALSVTASIFIGLLTTGWAIYDMLRPRHNESVDWDYVRDLLEAAETQCLVLVEKECPHRAAVSKTLVFLTAAMKREIQKAT